MSNPESDTCVDDLHIVTEKEWQEMRASMDRTQKALAHLLNAMDHQDKFNQTLIKGLDKLGHSQVKK